MELIKLKMIDKIVQDESLSDGDRIDEIAEYCKNLGTDEDAVNIFNMILLASDEYSDSKILDDIADYIENKISG